MEIKASDFKARRKFINRIGESRMIAIPPYFLASMGALGAKEAILTVADRDHIMIEIVRDEHNEH